MAFASKNCILVTVTEGASLTDDTLADYFERVAGPISQDGIKRTGRNNGDEIIVRFDSDKGTFMFC